MAPYEAMYGQPCRSPIYWTKVREDALLGSELVRETTEKLCRGIIRVGKKGKLSPRYIGPFEILAQIGEVAYRLVLPPKFTMSSTFLCYRNIWPIPPICSIGRKSLWTGIRSLKSNWILPSLQKIQNPLYCLLFPILVPRTHTHSAERERERESSVRGERRQPYLRPAVPTTGAASPPAAITTNRAHLQPSSIRRSSNRRRSSSHHHHQALIIITTTTDQHLPPPSNPSPAGHHCHWSHLHCRAHHHHRPSSEPPPSLSKPRFAGQKVPKMEQKCSYDSIKFNPNEEEAENHGFCTHSRSD
ncbi:uncharacterized protein LOC131307161 [Rhododendron vialii]|uniref:uncharacterized protein LOC131307161 n=1 Tax=Rhododendron vialii TaxID=182163 RepID=UPI00265F0B4F|nr:uncharacterized protein LOC131307161 [Rhododendron vialii]